MGKRADTYTIFTFFSRMFYLGGPRIFPFLVLNKTERNLPGSGGYYMGYITIIFQITGAKTHILASGMSTIIEINETNNTNNGNLQIWLSPFWFQLKKSFVIIDR